MTEQVTHVTRENRAKLINEKAQTLLAVQELEWNDKNFLTNPKSCCQMQKEYLKEIIRLSASIIR